MSWVSMLNGSGYSCRKCGATFDFEEQVLHPGGPVARCRRCGTIQPNPFPTTSVLSGHTPPVDIIHLVEDKLAPPPVQPARTEMTKARGTEVRREAEILRETAQTASENAAAHALKQGTPSRLTEQARQLPDSVPALLSAKDLTHVLRDLLGKVIAERAVESFLRRYRNQFPDSFITVDDDDRRKNQPKYLYRTNDVLPVLKEHFGRVRRTND